MCSSDLVAQAHQDIVVNQAIQDLAVFQDLVVGQEFQVLVGYQEQADIAVIQVAV